MSKHALFLSTVVGKVEDITGEWTGGRSDYVVPLSDGTIIISCYGMGFNLEVLKSGMVVLCKCEKVAGGFITRTMAKVNSFEEDGVTPDDITIIYQDPIYGENIVLTGKKIIDHRKGHHPGCSHD